MVWTMDNLFALGNGIAMAGWIGLAVAPLAPRWRTSIWRLTGIAMPALLAVGYLALVAPSLAEVRYGSLAQVRGLFDNPSMLLAGWWHYLAFDLFVGTWIARDGQRTGVPHWALLPCLALTFMFGPLGLLAYLGTRAAVTRTLKSALQEI